LIAVINQDTGADTPHGNRNYAAHIIANILGDDYRLVSPAMAQTGMDTGLYAATLTFPADFSYRILTLDNRYPQRTTLDFRVNPHLPEARYIEVYAQLLALQIAINTTLADMYIHSVLAALHDGQDQIEQIFANDLATQAALAYLFLDAFAAALQLDHLPDNPLETVPVDVTTQVELLRTYADRIADLYLGAYHEASSAHALTAAAVVALMTGFNTGAQTWVDNLEDWAELIENYSGQVATYSTAIHALRGLLDTWHGGLDDWNTALAASWANINADHTALATWYAAAVDRETNWEDFWDEVIGFSNGTEEFRKALLDLHDDEVERLNNHIAAINTAAGEVASWFEDLEEFHGEAVDLQADLALIEAADLPWWFETFLTDVANMFDTRPEPVPADGHQAYLEALEEWVLDWFGISYLAIKIVTPFGGLELEIPPVPPQSAWDNLEDLFDPERLEDQRPINIPDALTPIDATDIDDLIENLELDLVAPDRLNQPDPPTHIQIPHLRPLAPQTPPDQVANPNPTRPDRCDPNNTNNTPTGQNCPLPISPTQPETLLTAPATMTNHFEAFDPARFLTQEITEAIAAQVATYETAGLAAINTEANLQFLENITLLQDVRHTYTDYLRTLRETTQTAEQTEINNLHERLTTFHQNAETNSTDTQTRLNQFAGLLPESQQNGTINTNLIAFTAAPILLNNPNPRIALEGPITKTAATQPWIYIAFATLTITTISGLIIQTNTRNKF